MKKTQKSFKKKALLSSMSMLLVATVAVGSATFAWFTSSPTANAQGLQLKATASNGLKIITQSHLGGESTDNATFSSIDYLNYDPNPNGDGKAGSSKTSFLLTPASYTFDTTQGTMSGPYTTTAEKDSASAALGTAAVTSASVGYDNNQNVYAEKIFCKLVGAANENDQVQLNLDKITVTWNTTTVSDLQNTVRILVTYAEDGSTEKIIGAYSKEAIPTEKSLAGTIAAATTEQDKTTLGYAHVDEGTVKFDAMPTSKTPLGKLGTAGSQFVRVYIYIDGEDGACTSSNIKAADLITKIDVQLGIEDLPIVP